MVWTRLYYRSKYIMSFPGWGRNNYIYHYGYSHGSCRYHLRHAVWAHMSLSMSNLWILCDSGRGSAQSRTSWMRWDIPWALNKSVAAQVVLSIRWRYTIYFRYCRWVLVHFLPIFEFLAIVNQFCYDLWSSTKLFWSSERTHSIRMKIKSKTLAMMTFWK